MKRLIEQTACEHGKFEGCRCLGGSIRELTMSRGLRMSVLLPPAKQARLAEMESAREWVRIHPDWSLRDYADAWGVAASTVLRTFRRAGVKRSGSVYGTWVL